jgi:hypothetical protein
VWQFLEDITNSFILLRDVFGYLIPGAVCVGLLTIGYPALSNVNGKSVPAWVAVAIIIGVCYAVGQVLVGLGYQLYSVVDRLRRDPSQAATAADIAYYKFVYPSLFRDSDRRDTINIMRIGLAVALLVTAHVLVSPLSIAAYAVGAFLIYNGYTGQNHVRSYVTSMVEAAKKAEENKIPYFQAAGGMSKP